MVKCFWLTCNSICDHVFFTVLNFIHTFEVIMFHWFCDWLTQLWTLSTNLVLFGLTTNMFYFKASSQNATEPFSLNTDFIQPPFSKALSVFTHSGSPFLVSLPFPAFHLRFQSAETFKCQASCGVTWLYLNMLCLFTNTSVVHTRSDEFCFLLPCSVSMASCCVCVSNRAV